MRGAVSGRDEVFEEALLNGLCGGQTRAKETPLGEGRRLGPRPSSAIIVHPTMQSPVRNHRRWYCLRRSVSHHSPATWPSAPARPRPIKGGSLPIQPHGGITLTCCNFIFSIKMKIRIELIAERAAALKMGIVERSIHDRKSVCSRGNRVEAPALRGGNSGAGAGAA
jgi:hypothetical protein